MPSTKPTTTRESILHAAAVMFGDKGLVHTTTEQLIQAAGCSTGTFYRCIGRKENLVHVAYEYVDEFLGHTAGRWPDHWVPTQDERYNELLGLWVGVAARALEQPRYFYFWQQYRSSTYGEERLREEGWVLGPFHDRVQPILQQLLLEVPKALEPRPVSTELAGLLWIGQWTAVLAYSQARAGIEIDTRLPIMAQAFQAWWMGLQLGPLPRPAAMPVVEEFPPKYGFYQAPRPR
ncbi:TetR/AcrR family transcriptional regulator [Hymenobacter sp. BT730]|uniref:TetR/AcrR family transcriptional regulator n=1 Tax=Hymenobacter sp. BT730 TaxID=3063332 RepID=UPI0026DECD53|nr:TetR/AcrR family transcriptional regulator [Hymenobacter sp. BT730]